MHKPCSKPASYSDETGAEMDKYESCTGSGINDGTSTGPMTSRTDQSFVNSNAAGERVHDGSGTWDRDAALGAGPDAPPPQRRRTRTGQARSRPRSTRPPGPPAPSIAGRGSKGEPGPRAGPGRGGQEVKGERRVRGGWASIRMRPAPLLDQD